MSIKSGVLLVTLCLTAMGIAVSTYMSYTMWMALNLGFWKWLFLTIAVWVLMGMGAMIKALFEVLAKKSS